MAMKHAKKKYKKLLKECNLGPPFSDSINSVVLMWLTQTLIDYLNFFWISLHHLLFLEKISDQEEILIL